MMCRDSVEISFMGAGKFILNDSVMKKSILQD